MAVVDASVAVAQYVADDPGHLRAVAWYRSHGNSGEATFAPAILLPELAGSISRLTGNPLAGRQAVDDIFNDPFVVILPVSGELARRAAEIAAEYSIRGCDAVYVALAENLGQPLVTLDNQQFERGATVVETRRP